MKVQSNQNLIYRYNFKRGCDGENPEQMEPSLYLHFLLQSHLSITEMAVAFILPHSQERVSVIVSPALSDPEGTTGSQRAVYPACLFSLLQELENFTYFPIQFSL